MFLLPRLSGLARPTSLASKSFCRSQLPPKASLKLFHTSRTLRDFNLSTYLVTPNQLAHAIVDAKASKDDSRLVPLSAAWFLPNDPEGRTGLESFKKKHIADSRFFDIDVIKDETAPYPHMLPTAETFAKAMGDMGIRKTDTVVVYDTEELGIISAPRVAWTLSIFGHRKVHVLNNFRLWCKDGHMTVSGDPKEFPKEEYEMPQTDNLPLPEVATFEYMKGVVLAGGRQQPGHAVTVDARPHGRWAGLDPEPRPGLESGHMPGATSIPYAELLDTEDKTILPAPQLRSILKGEGIDPTGPIVSTCGTGITAAIVDLAMGEAAGTHGARQSQHSRKIYDGSWTEWAQRCADEPGMIKKADAKHKRFISKVSFKPADT